MAHGLTRDVQILSVYYTFSLASDVGKTRVYFEHFIVLISKLVEIQSFEI